jgi:hypothetical protein
MNTLIGILAVMPPEAATDDSQTASWAQTINERVQPPLPVTPDDIHVRALRLVSDEVNEHGGRFPRDEHDKLCALLVDTPVLIGHDRSRLPVARNFAARVAADGDRQWVEVCFYWRKGARGDRLAADIDAGVVKEGSIGFEFRTPRCSVCGRDIRACEHIPGREYVDSSGRLQSAHYEYRDLVRVLETSLVYRGATPGTHFVQQAFCKTDPTLRSIPLADGAQAIILDDCGEHEGLNEYLAVCRRIGNDFTFRSAHRFGIGDRIIRDSGEWVPVADGHCLIPVADVRLYRVTRPTASSLLRFSPEQRLRCPVRRSRPASLRQYAVGGQGGSVSR